MSSERTQRSHREMYKARTPPWKETYRKVSSLNCIVLPGAVLQSPDQKG